VPPRVAAVSSGKPEENAHMRRPRLDTWSDHVDRTNIRESRHYLLFMAVLILGFTGVAWAAPDYKAPPTWSLWAAVGVAGALVAVCFWSWVQPLWALVFAAACMLGLFLVTIFASDDMSGFPPSSLLLLLPVLYGIRSAWRLHESGRTGPDEPGEAEPPVSPE
jgi:hypothetical protein